MNILINQNKVLGFLMQKHRTHAITLSITINRVDIF